MPRTMVTTGPTISSPVWAGDYGDREHLVPGGAKLDATQFQTADAVQVVVGAAGAAGGATSVPVAALSGPIPNNTVLDFPGTTKYAKLTAAAATGAVTLTVEALPAALVSGDTAIYQSNLRKVILSGTPVGRTLAERDAGTGFGPAVDTDDEIYLMYNEVTNADDINDIELYRPRSIVKENFLPGFASWTTALKTKIRAIYVCTRGAD